MSSSVIMDILVREKIFPGKIVLRPKACPHLLGYRYSRNCCRNNEADPPTE
jgi:hypothetical protein